MNTVVQFAATALCHGRQWLLLADDVSEAVWVHDHASHIAADSGRAALLRGSTYGEALGYVMAWLEGETSSRAAAVTSVLLEHLQCKRPGPGAM